jgi:NitT/TauT family transport system permease protein
VLQSIPVLSFLPGVMLALVTLIPTRQLGVELGVVILIFTGQVWSMAFSFYSSLKSIPRELHEATLIYGLTPITALFHFGIALQHHRFGLELNGVSRRRLVFPDGVRDVRAQQARLSSPWAWSYLQTAASVGDTVSILWGLATMIGVIVLLDQLVWRPIIAWSDKFKFEQVESVAVPRSPCTDAWSTSSRCECRSSGFPKTGDD